MKVLVQQTLRSAEDYLQIESRDWRGLPHKPLPVGGEELDGQGGWISALNVQGVVFEGYDHYAVEELPNDGLRVFVWNDDVGDFGPLPGNRAVIASRPDDEDPDIKLPGPHARIWTFAPLAPDTALQGAYNTRQTQEVFADDPVASWIHPWPMENTVLRPWSDFRAPTGASVKHGIWVPNRSWTEHRSRRSRHGWREWTEGLPLEEIADGRLRAQAPLGRTSPHHGTITYYHTATALNTGCHVGDHELEMSGTPGSGQVTAEIKKSAEEFAFVFTTLENNPNSADWPSGVYDASLDVDSLGANISYGLLTIGGADGHFAVVPVGLTTDTETQVQTDAAYTTAGIKTPATATWNPAAGVATDRYELCIAAGNTHTKDAQTLVLNVDSADGYGRGPWTAPLSAGEQMAARMMGPPMTPPVAPQAVPY